MPAGRGMTTSPVMGRPGVKLHEGKASGLVVKVWDAQARSLLSFSLNERIRARTTVKVRHIGSIRDHSAAIEFGPGVPWWAI